MPFKRSLAKNAKKLGKNGLSILGDIGAYPYKSKSEDLVDYESSLPAKYDLHMKGFCSYHYKNFDRFSNEQEQKLIGRHGKALNIIHHPEEIKLNLKWEREYRLKLKNKTIAVLCTYPVEDIIPKLSDSRGAHAKWTRDLLEIYDGVIFVRRFWRGVAFNLDNLISDLIIF